MAAIRDFGLQTLKHTQYSHNLTVTTISPPPRKPVLRISSTVASESGFLAVWIFQLLYCSTSFTCGGRSTTATDASKWLEFINGASACTYELHTLDTRGRGHALLIFSVEVPHAHDTPIQGRTIPPWLSASYWFPRQSTNVHHNTFVFYN
ncbi:hypothetical protein EVAR_55118_1 [Eumeta japonica]|uniref:Uncharacterized protein n=1 Tax=Eumeta variegata TaxID=151549 RepID=A0A4C1YBF3_EUMVA|nr:hypothetical protein EVAR_55118_1 [Eumeta japonica]